MTNKLIIYNPTDGGTPGPAGPQGDVGPAGPQGPAGPGSTDATTSTKGAVQLAGDLAGTAASPTVPALAGKEAVANKDTDTTLASNSDTKYPSQKAIKTYVDGLVASGTVDATPTVKGKLQLAGDLAGTAAAPTVPGLANRELLANKDVDQSMVANSDTNYPSQKAVKAYVDTQTTPQATSVVQGKLKLTNHLGGTADLPTVPGLVTKEDVANKDIDTLLSANSDTRYPSQRAVKTYVDINANPDATTATKGKLKLAGDLAGTADTPTVPSLTLKENLANKDTDVTLAANSDTKYASQKAAKAYTDSSVSTTGALKTDKSTLTTAGDLYVASGTSTPARLAATVNNGDILTIDTSLTQKVKWDAPRVVNVKSYGAVGDATFIDQRTTGNNFGMAASTPVNSATFGKGYTDDTLTTPATDNTTAFRNAFDALLNQGSFALYKRGSGAGTNFGYKALRRELVIPAGAYYISDAASLFAITRAAPSGTQHGFTIRGAGPGNTILYVRITGSTSTDFLFYDNNAFDNLTLRDVTIVGTTGNERMFYQTSSGTAKRWIIDRCEFRDYKNWLVVEGTVNADRWVIYNCEWVTYVESAVMFQNLTNTQALGYDFHSPTIVHFNGGTLWHVGTGTVHVFGGDSAIYGTPDGFVAKTGTVHSFQLWPAVVIYGHKTELHDNAGYADLSGSRAVFDQCDMALLGSTRTAPHVIVRLLGGFEYNGGFMDDLKFASSTDVTNNYYSSERNEICIRNAVLANPDLMTSKYTRYTTAGDGITTLFDLTGSYTGSSGVPRIYVSGCRPNNINYGTGITKAPNGAPFWSRAYAGRQPEIQIVNHAYDGNHVGGLPTLAGTNPQITIPINCELRKIVISKQEGTGAGTWQVVDGDGVVVCGPMTAVSTDTYSFTYTEHRRRVDTDNKRTFTLDCTAGAGGAVGYFSVEYI